MTTTDSFSYADESRVHRLNTFRDSVYTKYGKRAFDLLFAVLLLPLLLPIIGVVAIFVKRDGGPAFFAHKRVGKDGKEFGCLKLRSMRTDAEEFLEAYLAGNEEAQREWQANFKLKDDPRITKIGKFIRKTSLDELPQIFNVLKGEMSFVGPRPVPRKELEQYGLAKIAYVAGRPGITGLWQIGGRNDIDYDERIELDLKYRKEENFKTDVRCIIMTPVKILKPTGI